MRNKVKSKNTVITLCKKFSWAYPLSQSYPTLLVSCPSYATISQKAQGVAA